MHHAGAVGDFITTLPAIRLWRQNNRNSRLVFLGKAATGRLGLKSGYFDEALDIDRAAYSAFFSTDISAALVAFLKKFDTAILFSATDSPLVSVIKQAGVFNIFQQLPRPTDHRHVVGYHLELFKGLYGLAEPDYPVINVLRGDGDQSGTQPIVLHHGSGSLRKNWPTGSFSSLAKRLRGQGHSIFWIQGPADLSPPATNEDNVFKSDDLWACAKLLSRAHLYVGNDSGITHLAAAVGCKTIALFGASNPIVWAPFGPHVQVITSSTDCGPCHMQPQTVDDCGRQCMAAIDVGHVFQQCDTLLKES